MARELPGAGAATVVAALLAACAPVPPPSPAASVAPLSTASPTASPPATTPPPSPTPAPTPLPSPSGFTWSLPAGIAPPAVPSDNPMTPPKIALGRRLFYEKRLSVNNTTSCGTCHEQGRGFTDGRPVAIGATGMHHTRNSMGLANVAYASVLTWGNPLMTTLEVQTVVPLVGDQPVEIGYGLRPAEILATLKADADYADRFRASFPGEPDPFKLGNLAKAISAFERTMLSFDSPYDRALRGDAGAMSPAAKRGSELFFGERLECAHCHDGPFFTDAVQPRADAKKAVFFHNTGLYNLGPGGLYPVGGQGVFEVTVAKNDMGKFRAPTLRNIAVTGPYFHDGSAATLGDALDHYRVGGRTIASGPLAGVGAKNPLKDPLIGGFALSEGEKADVIAFLESLTDATFLANPDLSDPFARQPGVQ